MNSQLIERHFKYCPRCGARNPRCGEVPFRCAECMYAQFFGPVAGVGALVVNDRNQLLLVGRARDPGKGKWGLPGGFVDRGESIEQALLRETFEETKLQIVQQQYLTTYPNDYDYRGIVIPVIDLFFVCRVAQPGPIELDDQELSHFLWVQPDESHLDNMAFSSNRFAIETWLASSQFQP